MAGVDVDAVKIVPYGTIAGTQDWSTGWFFKASGLTGPPSSAVMATMLSDLESDLQYWFNQLKGYATSSTKLEGVRGYFYPAHSGVSTVVAELVLTSAISGTSSTVVPTQTCVVASLRTGISGRSARGRSYFPATGIVLQPDGQLPSSDAQAFATHYGNVLADLAFDIASSLGSSGVAPIVWSGKTGGTHQVTTVLCDSRPDIQRRRADKIVPTYQETAPVTPH